MLFGTARIKIVKIISGYSSYSTLHCSRKFSTSSMTSERSVFETVSFACVICRCPFPSSPHYDKWLAVEEIRNRGWWIPAGGVDAGESFEQAALRECMEEAGVPVKLKGVLKVDHRPDAEVFRRKTKNGQGPPTCDARMRVVFYAEPVDEEAALAVKTVPDEESLGARWVTMAELDQLAQQKPGLRSDELPKWGRYIEAGGEIFPMKIFSGREGTVLDPEKDRAFTVFPRR